MVTFWQLKKSSKKQVLYLKSFSSVAIHKEPNDSVEFLSLFDACLKEDEIFIFVEKRSKEKVKMRFRGSFQLESQYFWGKSRTEITEKKAGFQRIAIRALSLGCVVLLALLLCTSEKILCLFSCTCCTPLAATRILHAPIFISIESGRLLEPDPLQVFCVFTSELYIIHLGCGRCKGEGLRSPTLKRRSQTVAILW
ncbi:hypothetical protein AV530_011978 [Patagioenas fasciata monilis]|uniref:Uncharacterized protein n=1 Tax=Patagioenas fasciata monilis TaxID=372326 RepID=A0A1V4JVX1_PATFA|nr:hypothetical protein AV530_011978 [Patagioenas fasciata monilis]